MEPVNMAVDGAIATVQFANPAQRGALTPEILSGVSSGLRALGHRHPDVRVVVLRGDGDAFSRGYAIDRIPEPAGLAVKDEIELLCEEIENSPLIVIAMLQDVVVGAALDVAAACDFRLSSRGCRLGITPARLGLVYTVAGTARIHRLAGPEGTRRLFLTADLVPAEEARRMGLVSEVFDDPQSLEEATYQLASTIAARAPRSLVGAKRILRELEASSLGDEQMLALHELRREALGSADAAEARSAFAAKRAPNFTGREP